MSTFADRIELAQRLKKKIQDFERLHDGKPFPISYLESLEAEIEAHLNAHGLTSTKSPSAWDLFGNFAEFGRMAKILSLQEAVSSLGAVRLAFSRNMRIRDFLSHEPPPSVEFFSEPSLSDHELSELLCGKSFKTGWSSHRFKPELTTRIGAGCFLQALALAFSDKLDNPMSIDICPPYWNRSRVFNPDRILDLRIDSLTWNELDSHGIVRVEFSDQDVALKNPEARKPRSSLRLPEHPTINPPWRVMRLQNSAQWHEVSLGSSVVGAWKNFLNQEIEFLIYLGRDPKEQIDVDCLMSLVDGYRPGEVLQVASGIRESCLGDYRILEDSPELEVVGSRALAEAATREGIKAREIWFRRFESVIAEGLPDAVTTVRFVLRDQPPKSPHCTFIARLNSTDSPDVPLCPECGRPFDRVVHLSFRHHSLPFPLPGSSLLLFTCGESNGAHNCDDMHWHKRWISREAIPRLIPPLLAEASSIVAGPAVRVLEYENELVDREAFDQHSPQWSNFNDRREKAFFTFATPGTKVGGTPSWVQGACHLNDLSGVPMQFISQIDHELIEIGDSGRAYVLFSPGTGEIKVITQCF